MTERERSWKYGLSSKAINFKRGDSILVFKTFDIILAHFLRLNFTPKSHGCPAHVIEPFKDVPRSQLTGPARLM